MKESLIQYTFAGRKYPFFNFEKCETLQAVSLYFVTIFLTLVVTINGNFLKQESALGV